MNLINLNVFINDILYKKLTVPADSNGKYDSRPIMMELLADKQSGSLNKFNIESGMSIKIEIEK